uniref:Uncharacterized protein n=1 Tax=Arundo donax TaxID=35708 RepID=A0A0A9C591_ARUDO
MNKQIGIQFKKGEAKSGGGIRVLNRRLLPVFQDLTRICLRKLGDGKQIRNRTKKT